GRRLGPGIDVRGDGGYVIAPPSRHASGARYTWASCSLVVPNLPESLLERLVARAWQPQPSGTLKTHDRVGAQRWAAAALEREGAAVAAAVEGTRNHRLNLAAFRLGQIVAAGLLDRGDVETTLHAEAASAGLTTREA